MLSTLPVIRLENEISRIITRPVCHFFSRLDFPTTKFLLFCVVWTILMFKHRTFPLQLRYAIVNYCYITIWLVFARCVLANSVATRVNEYFLDSWRHVTSHMTSFIIPFPSILNVWRRGGWQPCTSGSENQYVKYMSLCQYAIHVKVHCEISQSEMFIEQHKLSYVIPTLPLDNYAVQ